MAERRFAGEEEMPATLANENGTYSIGSKLGQGGFGSVHIALNVLTGQTVAVKSVLSRNLTDESRASIQMEINLLKALDHPNIVKYIDTIVHDADLYIILEYMENGSIAAMRKKFRFQEPLIAHWIEQVLRGLEYLHEQGVLHRDIKGANILTTKNGEVKLADFGVAKRQGAGADADEAEDVDVVGTPYWMAPEIIQMSKPTEACDIWAVGCTIIELVTGKPPYYDLQPMAALFRIVSDDYPPFPEGISKALHDFLIACFQKDPNMRPRAADLLRASKYRWIQQKTKIQRGSQSPITFVDSVDDSVNEEDHEMIQETIRIARTQLGALEAGAAPHAGTRRSSPSPPPQDDDRDATIRLGGRVAALAKSESIQSASTVSSLVGAAAEHSEEDEDWDAAFEEEEAQPQAPAAGAAAALAEDLDDVDDQDLTIRINKQLRFSPAAAAGGGGGGGGGRSARGSSPAAGPSQPHHVARKSLGGFEVTAGASQRRLNSFVEFSTEGEGMDDDFGMDDFDLGESGDLVLVTNVDEGKGNSLSHSQRASMHTAEDYLEEEDPFAEFDDEEEDAEETLQRDLESERLTECMGLMSQLRPDMPDGAVVAACDRLCELFREYPRIRENLMTQHGVVPVMEMLTIERESVLPAVLRVVNCIVERNERIQEHVSLMGLLPVMIRFAAAPASAAQAGPRWRKGKSRGGRPRGVTPLQCEAARFIRTTCIDESGGSSRKTVLQMFIGCGGLELLVSMLSLAGEGDLGSDVDRCEVVRIAVDGIGRVFTLQTLRKNDFCRLLAKYGLVVHLLDAFEKFLIVGDATYATGVAKLLEGVANYARADWLLKDYLTKPVILSRVVAALRRTRQGDTLVLLLKSVKHVCMSFGGGGKAAAAIEPFAPARTAVTAGDALSTLDEAGIIKFLVDLLKDAPAMALGKEVEYQAVPILFYLCLVNKKRQEKAARVGVVPHMRRYIEERSHLQHFATQILCDMAHASHLARRILREEGILELYVRLLQKANWDHSALDAITTCFANDQVGLEPLVVSGVPAIIELFCTAHARKGQVILANLVQLAEASGRLSMALGASDLFMSELVERLRHANAFQKTDLLKLLKAIYKAEPQKAQLIAEYNLVEIVSNLASDSAQIVVMQLAGELLVEFQGGGDFEGPGGASPRTEGAAPVAAAKPRPASHHGRKKSIMRHLKRMLS